MNSDNFKSIMTIFASLFAGFMIGFLLGNCSGEQRVASRLAIGEYEISVRKTSQGPASQLMVGQQLIMKNNR
jgi:hypothetical protein